MKKQYTSLLEQLRDYGPSPTIALFTNQTAFDLSEGKYLVRLVAQIAGRTTLLVPEHGFFTELQDQEEVDLHEQYAFLPEGIEHVSLYRKGHKGFHPDAKTLEGFDVIIIDIQDIGSRYYTYVTTMAELLKTVTHSAAAVRIILVDHPNLAGRQVEGTLLPPDYTSLIGWEGIPHRYGLTLGELSLLIRDQLKGEIDLEVLPFDPGEESGDVPINPSPNIPQPATLRVFTGQCLIEGTNLSEGRGTTRPFEIFGAPFMDRLSDTWVQDWNREHPEAVLRPLVFVPVFHKYSRQRCHGFQLHPAGEDFHSLWYSLQLIREMNHQLDGFEWLEGPYESGSDKKAIEILAGDPVLIDYLDGGQDDLTVKQRLSEQEAAWIEKAKAYLLYDRPLVRGHLGD